MLVERAFRFYFIAIVVALLNTACGGSGGGGSPTPPPTPAPSGFSYPVPPAFAINQAITPLQPTITGTVTSYAVNPALPGGLSINASSGVVSGTPTAITPKTTYTVTASGPGGNATAQIAIVVTDVPAAISYVSPSYTFTAGVSGQIGKPTVSGGTVVSWSVSPDLPTGLILSNTDGSISGTPEGAAAAATYTVTATNSGGQASASLKLAVVAGPVLDLGHTARITAVRIAGTRALSQDAAGHWIIWNQATHAQVAGGTVAACEGTCTDTTLLPAPLPVDLAGPAAVIGTVAGLDVRAASDGHLIASIAAPDLAWWLLSSDGSYICGANKTSLKAWSTATGQLLFSRDGNYSTSGPFAQAAQIVVAAGPAGANVVESIAVPAGTASVSPAFQGSFLRWFFDGGHFLTRDTTANRIYVYSDTGAQQDAVIISGSLATNVFGQGNSFWTLAAGAGTSNTLTTYTVGSSSAPSATFNISGYLDNNPAMPSGHMLAIVANDLHNTTETLSLFDFSSAPAPTRVDYAVPVRTAPFAGVSSTQWVAGETTGQVLDGAQVATPGFFNYGKLVHVVGGASYFAALTQTGQILYFDAGTHDLLGTLNASASKVAISSDGSLLFAQVPNAVNVYSLPSGALRNSLAIPPGYTRPDFLSSGSGNVVVLVDNASTYTAYPSAGGASLWSLSGQFDLGMLSPDGSMFANSYLPRGPGSGSNTTFFKNGALVTSHSGTGFGWIDNNRLVVNDYDAKYNIYVVGHSLYDATGALLGHPRIPAEISFQVADASQAVPDLLFTGEGNVIYSLSRDAITWASATYAGVAPYGPGLPGTAAATAHEAVFEASHFLVAEPY